MSHTYMYIYNILFISKGFFSRWEFIQGESAMQRKYVSANRSSASRSYRKKLQKRLWQHKQQLHELEQVKKAATFKVRILFFTSACTRACRFIILILKFISIFTKR